MIEDYRPIDIFLIVFGAHMNFLFMIKLEIPFLLNDHIGPSNYVDNEPTILNKFRAHSLVSFKHWSLWSPFLDPHLDHIPLKYRCPIKVSVQIRSGYLI
jgi:hypothetical protein